MYVYMYIHVLIIIIMSWQLMIITQKLLGVLYIPICNVHLLYKILLIVYVCVCVCVRVCDLLFTNLQGIMQICL